MTNHVVVKEAAFNLFRMINQSSDKLRGQVLAIMTSPLCLMVVHSLCS